MKFPSVITSALIVGLLAVLNHLLANVGAFHVSELYAPIIVAVLTTAIKAVQEWTPAQPAAARGLDSAAEAGYWARVLYK
jgi:hypothetical protein